MFILWFSNCVRGRKYYSIKEVKLKLVDTRHDEHNDTAMLILQMCTKQTLDINTQLVKTYIH